MSDVLDALRFYLKIVYDEAEHDRPPHMAIYAWCELSFVLAFGCQAGFYRLICQDACFGKAVHPAFNFYVDVPIVRDLEEVVSVDDLLGEDV